MAERYEELDKLGLRQKFVRVVHGNSVRKLAKDCELTRVVHSYHPGQDHTGRGIVHVLRGRRADGTVDIGTTSGTRVG